jgi:hypothetical protein
MVYAFLSTITAVVSRFTQKKRESSNNDGIRAKRQSFGISTYNTNLFLIKFVA